MTGLSNSKKYSLFKRGDIYYAYFRLPDGKRSTPKSTGQTSRGKAENWCLKYWQTGQIVFRENVTLAEFSKDFFSWEGTWATSKRSTGRRLSRHHCKQQNDLVKNHITPQLGHLRLTQITKHTLNNLRNELHTAGYSGNTINKILNVLLSILQEAEEQFLIQFVPKVKKAVIKPKRKGILTIEEVKKLFSIKWNSERVHCHPARDQFFAYAGNLLAAASGLRISELQALTLQDVHLDSAYIRVWRSWDKLFGLNETTKNGKERNILLPGNVITVLEDLVSFNPDPSNPESFLFYSQTPGKPVEQRLFTAALYTSLKRIGITEELRRQRNITFHSWRHFFNSLLLNNGVSLQKVQALTGHLSNEMTQLYYHPDSMSDVVQTVQDKLFTPDKDVIN